MAEFAEAYHDLRGRVSGLMRAAAPEQLEKLAPATPEWRVRDLVAHLSGITADINAGNLDGVATDAWTARQVDARRDWPMARLLDEWDTESAKVEPLMSELPATAVGQMLADAVTHEHDIRGGLDAPGARDSSALALAFAWMGGALEFTVGPAGVTLHVGTEAREVVTGSGDRQVRVRAPRFELVRSMTGRRSFDQMRGYEWEAEPEPELLVLAIFTPRPTPLVE